MDFICCVVVKIGSAIFDYFIGENDFEFAARFFTGALEARAQGSRKTAALGVPEFIFNAAPIDENRRQRDDVARSMRSVLSRNESMASTT